MLYRILYNGKYSKVIHISLNIVIITNYALLLICISNITDCN